MLRALVLSNEKPPPLRWWEYVTKHSDGYIMKTTNKTGSYFSIILSKKGTTKSTKMHRLVAEHFIPNPENKKQVNHIDCNKQNNYVENLEWCTAKENVHHAMKNGLSNFQPMIDYNHARRIEGRPRYEPKGLYKKIKKNIVQLSYGEDYINTFPNASFAGKQTGVCARNILHVCRKEEGRTQAGGYIWMYEDDYLKWSKEIKDIEDNIQQNIISRKCFCS